MSLILARMNIDDFLDDLRQEEELQARTAKITELGMQVASEGRQRAEERRGRTEAERRLRAEKQVRATNCY